MKRVAPFYLLLASAVLWAMQPTFILAFRNYFDGGASMMVINTAATALVSVIYLSGSGFRPLRLVFGDRRIRRPVVLVVALDGVLIAFAYYFLYHSGGLGKMAASAVFFEAWPIVSALFLFAFFPKEGDRGYVAFLSSIFLMVGFLIMNRFAFGLGERGFLLYGLLSALFFGLGVGAIQGLIRKIPVLSDATVFPVITLLRASVTTLALLGIVGTNEGLGSLGGVSPTELLVAGFFGVLVFANSVLFHVGSYRASSNSVSLVTLLSPVLAPLFILALNLDAPDQYFYIGAAFVFCGVAVASRSGDISAEAQVLFSCLLVFGSAVLLTDGTQEESQFFFVDTVSIFYVLLQSAAYGRVAGVRDSIRMTLLDLSDARAARDRQKAARKVREIRLARRSVGNFSETILITVLGVGTIAVSFLSRPMGLIGDLSTFFISCAVAFMTTMTWGAHLSAFRSSRWVRADSRTRYVLTGVLRQRAFSYLTMVALLAWFAALIVQKNLPDVAEAIRPAIYVQPVAGPR